MTVFDRAGIAERLRGLLAGQDKGDLGATAKRLGVAELSLRMSVDEVSPHPTMEVLVAIIHEYGVDPTWLLTGVYDPDTHRATFEGNAISAALRDFMMSRMGPISDPPREHFRVHEQN